MTNIMIENLLRILLILTVIDKEKMITLVEVTFPIEMIMEEVEIGNNIKDTTMEERIPMKKITIIIVVTIERDTKEVVIIQNTTIVKIEMNSHMKDLREIINIHLHLLQEINILLLQEILERMKKMDSKMMRFVMN